MVETKILENFSEARAADFMLAPSVGSNGNFSHSQFNSSQTYKVYVVMYLGIQSCMLNLMKIQHTRLKPTSLPLVFKAIKIIYYYSLKYYSILFCETDHWLNIFY